MANYRRLTIIKFTNPHRYEGPHNQSYNSDPRVTEVICHWPP